MKDYIKAINAVTVAIKVATFRDIEGDEIYKLSAAVSKILELAKRIDAGDVGLISKAELPEMTHSEAAQEDAEAGN